MNIGQLEHLVKRFQQGDVSATELGALSVAVLDLINAYLAGCRRVYSEFGFTHPQGAVLDPLPPGAVARFGSTRWPVTSRPSSSSRQNVVRSAQAKPAPQVASDKSRSPRWQA